MVMGVAEVVVVGAVVLVEAEGEIEDELPADLEVEGDGRDEADWEELVWRLDGMADGREGEVKRVVVVVKFKELMEGLGLLAVGTYGCN